VSIILELDCMTLVAMLVNIDSRHRNAALVDLGTIHNMRFKFGRGMVAVKTSFAEVYPTIGLGVLFTKKFG